VQLKRSHWYTYQNPDLDTNYPSNLGTVMIAILRICAPFSLRAMFIVAMKDRIVYADNRITGNRQRIDGRYYATSFCSSFGKFVKAEE